MTELSLVEARRIALRAQGFDSVQPGATTLAPLRRVVSRLGAVQIDSVSVLVRSHYLPAYSRLGCYDRKLFDRLTAPGQGVFEYWAHAACFVPLDLHGFWRWRMQAHERFSWWTRAQETIEKRNPGYKARVLNEITERGALSFTQLTDPARREREPGKYAASTLMWFGNRPSDGKRVLEGLWLDGVLAVKGRGPGFERIFDLTERVIPEAVLKRPALTLEDGQRALVLHAVQALGVAWLKELAFYYWLPVAVTKARLRELVEAGLVESVAVEGIKERAFLDPKARASTVAACVLLSPFDSLLWQRARNERLLGFRHSFEMYTPEKKRQYGYYVLPFLMGESITARVDLKADRATGSMLVPGAYAEPGVQPKKVAGELAAALRQMAAWLGLESVRVEDRGDLAASLRRAL